MKMEMLLLFIYVCICVCQEDCVSQNQVFGHLLRTAPDSAIYEIIYALDQTQTQSKICFASAAGNNTPLIQALLPI